MTTRFVRHTCSAAFVSLAAAAAIPASYAAESAWPTRPIRLLVPTSPGGGTDALARILAPRLGDMLGQQWVVDNRAGAAGNIAVELVAKAAPDGYTLKEFIALAKQKPGSLNVASAGIGTPVHLASELFKKRVGVNMVHIAYKGGGPAATAVLAGEAQVIFGSVASSMPHVRAGRLKALATTGIKRSKVAPDLPTIAESGYPGFDVRSWYAMLVTAKTPMAIVNRIHGAVIKVVGMPEVQEAMSRQGLEPETSTPQQLAARIKAETAVWAGVIKDSGIRVA